MRQGLHLENLNLKSSWSLQTLLCSAFSDMKIRIKEEPISMMMFFDSFTTSDLISVFNTKECTFSLKMKCER